ncbi:hypothetical protein UlMin_005339 [Ulmus minor]
MAKVAPPSSLPSTSLQIGGGAKKVARMVKRKTPSELRGEQLKRINAAEIVDESPSPLIGCTSELKNSLKKPELPRNPRYIETRMDELYPAKKSRFRMLSGKENVKESVSTEQRSSLKNLSVLSGLAAKKRQELQHPENSIASKVAKEDVGKDSQAAEKDSQSTFRSVTELSLRDDMSSGFASVDMDKALKGLAARESPNINGLPSYSTERCEDHASIKLGSFFLPGQKAPLDFTLKTSMRVVSSSPVTWIHQSLVCRSSTSLQCFGFACSENQNRSHNSTLTSTSQVFSSKIFHSWVYPQSTLPPSLISVLTSSAAEGVEMDFLRSRQQAWEDSFRSLYYMLRRSVCNIFYVCTPHFVVMFTGSDGLGKTKRLCNAYISQSTRSLRSLLQEHDVYFSMPLCRSKVEQVTREDLVELSEIEKQNLGQTRRLSSTSDIDNSPESFLVFDGNKNVQGLYDILLNYRSFLTVLMGMDVPVLYSPVPFQNGAFSAPEVKCMELNRGEPTPDKGSIMKDGESLQGLPSGFSSSVEIKDAYLPPWIISSICAVMGSEGRTFEASFTTEPTSIALNVALEAVSEKSDPQAASSDGLQEVGYAFGIPEAIVAPHLRSSLLKGLKYSNGSYTATRSSI